MKVLILGLGSIGRRHARCFRSLGVRAVAGVDPDPERRAQFSQELEAQAFATDAEGLGWNPDLAVVASPNVFHIPQALFMAQAGKPLLIEKPLGVDYAAGLKLAELLQEAELPDGVVNIVTGAGATGAAVVDHPDVNKVAFTGSTGVGKLIQRATAGSGKKLTLELGGKAANIIFADATIDQAVEGIINGIYFNQGHVCCAGSRLFVEEGVYDEVIRKLKHRMRSLVVGDPLDKNTDIGAINSREQLGTINKYLKAGVADGAEMYQPACELPSKGFWCRPTLFLHVAQSARIALDTAGRYLLSVNPAGEILWCTPQAVRLLEAALPRRDGRLVVPEPLQAWLRKAAAGGETSPPPDTIRTEGGQRQISLLSTTGEGEFLFRIAADAGGGEREAKLRRQFTLTGREAEVLSWIAQGKSNRDIGEILNLSPRTVNKHLEQIYQKLGVENRASAAIAALRALGED